MNSREIIDGVSLIHALAITTITPHSVMVVLLAERYETAVGEL